MKTPTATQSSNGVEACIQPEFLNRIDDVVVFKSLDRDHIHAIIDLELKALIERIEGLGYGIGVTKKTKDSLWNRATTKSTVHAH